MTKKFQINTQVINDILSTQGKAARINRYPNIYGTIAEIGAGQEVARAFYMAGNPSKTIAQSISEYDMTMSDEKYGRNGRYVCHERLQRMLNIEYSDLTRKLKSFSNQKTFFAFANTVALSSSRNKKPGHAWYGIKFQHEPNSQPNEVLIHVRLLERDRNSQMETLCMLGVNLIYAAYFHQESPKKFLLSLKDNLKYRELEIDVVHVEGEAFKSAGFCNRKLSLWLVKYGMTNAVMFNANGKITHPSEVLFGKPLFVLRSGFRPPTLVTLDMLRSGIEQFTKATGFKEDQINTVGEITLDNLKESGSSEEDYLSRIQLFNKLERNIMLSNYSEYYKLSQYLRQYTDSYIGMSVSAKTLESLFDATTYKGHSGNILNAMGELFHGKFRLFIYPNLIEGQPFTSKDIQVPDNLKHLYLHLKENDLFVDYQNVEYQHLHIESKEVLKKLQNGQRWEHEVPEKVVNIIKRDKLFSYQD